MVFPLDNEILPVTSLNIYQANKKLIDESGMVVANLNPFRGHEPDSGTVWEMGYACGTGKPVVGYISQDDSIVDRVVAAGGCKKKHGTWFDAEGMVIENFHLPLNLMLAHSLSALVIGDINDAASYIAKNFPKTKPCGNACAGCACG